MATPTPKRGESCLVLSIPTTDENDRVLTTLIPHTTSTRGSRFEIVIASRFLKTGAFDVQNVNTITTVKMIRMLGMLTVDEMIEIEAGLKAWLGLTD